MNARVGAEEFFRIVIRMAILYRLQEREYGAVGGSEDERIFSKIRARALREHGLDGRNCKNDLDAPCRLLLEDQSGFLDMLVNRTLAGRGVITVSDVHEVRRILNVPGASE